MAGAAKKKPAKVTWEGVGELFWNIEKGGIGEIHASIAGEKSQRESEKKG